MLVFEGVDPCHIHDLGDILQGRGEAPVPQDGNSQPSYCLTPLARAGHCKHETFQICYDWVPGECVRDGYYFGEGVDMGVDIHHHESFAWVVHHKGLAVVHYDFVAQGKVCLF